ncbi:MAG: hypothetical protein KDE27_22965, partial [Planctomycetes bacterium]|nr:hypothetical protein [Planctomycetota bacterium]
LGLLDLIAEQVAAHRGGGAAAGLPSPEWTAWALIGLGTASNLGRELGLPGTQPRQQMFAAIGGQLLG